MTHCPDTEPSPPMLTPPPEEWRRVLQLGQRGEDVASWQRVLLRQGYDLRPWGDDGDFGLLTEKRTLRFQMDRGLEADGKVGPQTRASIAAPVVARTDEWPFLQAANYTWANRASVRLIVIHTMESPEAPGTAEAVAAWFAGKSGEPPRASAHVCIDQDSAVRCVRPDHVAWAAPGANRDGYQVELAGRASQGPAQWADEASTATLEIAARHCARIAVKYGLPIVKLDEHAVRSLPGTGFRGHRSGFCGHVDVSKAFKKSTHTDPGPDFPWVKFLDMVSNHAA